MRIRLIVVASLVLSLATITFAADDPFTGTWRLDPSKTEDNNPSQIIMTPANNGISIQTDDQKPDIVEYGKDHLMNNGNMINIVRVDDRTLSTTFQRDGKVTAKETATVSADGRRYTRLQKGTGAERRITTLIYHRTGTALAGDSFFGTWRADPSKTRYEPPSTYTLRINGDTLDITRNETHVVSAKFDGKDYKNETSTSTTSVKRIDAQTIEIFQKNPNSPPITRQWQVKGKMLVMVATGEGAQGEPFKQVQYFERIK